AARDAYDVAQIQQLKKFESRLADHVEAHVHLHPPAVACKVREPSLSVRAQGNDSPGNAHRRVFRRQLLGCQPAKSFPDFSRCVRACKLMWIWRVAKRFDFAQFLAALRELVKRFKFQKMILSAAEGRQRRAVPQYNGPLLQASRKAGF